VSVAGERSWTGRVREHAVAALPPEKLLPDKQPSYVASWIYVFGVLSLALILIPFLPGIRDIPRWIPIYRIIWRNHYRALDQHAVEPLYWAPEGASP
jgi:hypothetical protein